MRTATPLATCWVITESGWSATSAAISTPRLTGPGCMISDCSGSRRARSPGQAVGGGVFAEGREERFGHALPLQPQQVDDVELGQHRVEVVGDLDRPAGQRRRQQRRRGHQGDLGPQGGEGQHVGAGHPAVADVADDGDVQALEGRAPSAARGAARCRSWRMV